MREWRMGNWYWDWDDKKGEMKTQEDRRRCGRKLGANDVTPLLWIFIEHEVILREQCETKTLYVSVLSISDR